MTTIPDKYVEMARELALLAQKYGLRAISARIDPGYRLKEGEKDWPHPINMTWACGRHGEDEKQITLASEIHLRTRTSWEGEVKTEEW